MKVASVGNEWSPARARPRVSRETRRTWADWWEKRQGLYSRVFLALGDN